MKAVEREILFDRFLVAIGMRQVWQDVDEAPTWEVYCRLTSGSDVVVASGCGREEAWSIMNYKTAEASYGGAAAFVVTEEDSMVDAEFIVRVYVDKDVNDFICGIEDVTGKHYRIARGLEVECEELAYKLASDIAIRTGGDQGGNDATINQQAVE